MTIEEAKSLKVIAEREIFESIQRLEDQTGLHVSFVQTWDKEDIGMGKVKVVSVKLSTCL